jgi:hypothetical protein
MGWFLFVWSFITTCLPLSQWAKNREIVSCPQPAKNTKIGIIEAEFVAHKKIQWQLQKKDSWLPTTYLT